MTGPIAGAPHAADAASVEAGSGADSQQVAPHSRPRGSQPPVGQAVPRRDVPRRRDTSLVLFPSSRYYPYYGAFGLGYFYYDPYWWYPSWPYYGSYGYYGPYSPYGYPYRYYDYGYSYDSGTLRLKVQPRTAQVFIDGYYVGTVDDFDGVFQRLRLQAGPHRVEIRADGYEPLVFDVSIIPGETITYRGELIRIR